MNTPNTQALDAPTRDAVWRAIASIRQGKLLTFPSDADLIEAALTPSRADTAGAEAIKVIDDVIAYGTGFMRDGKRVDPREVYIAPAGDAQGAVDASTVRRVAEHMSKAIEFIQKSYPNARQLDRGPIMRNLRRWSEQLTAAAPTPETPSVSPLAAQIAAEVKANGLVFEAPSRSQAGEVAAYETWFHSQQGTPYDGSWSFARAAWMHRARLTNPAPADSGVRDAVPESAERDAAVWALIAIAEQCGAAKDEGEQGGPFWTLHVDAFYALQTKMDDALNAMRHADAAKPESA